jgi:hypothetical protein
MGPAESKFGGGVESNSRSIVSPALDTAGPDPATAITETLSCVIVSSHLQIGKQLAKRSRRRSVKSLFENFVANSRQRSEPALGPITDMHLTRLRRAERSIYFERP